MTSPPPQPFDPGSATADTPPAPPIPSRPTSAGMPPAAPASPPAPGAGTGGDQDDGTLSQAADTAKEQASELASTAKEEAADVIGTAKEQVGQVAGDMADQARELIHTATGQIKEQAETQTSNFADTLNRTARQLTALGEGRTDDAGRTDQVVRQIGETVSQIAYRIDELGPDGIAAEVQRFARRRPGAFLAGAAAAGFLVSRFVRNASDHEGSGGQGGDGHQQALPASTGLDAARGAPGASGAPAGGPTTPPPASIPTAPGDVAVGRTGSPSAPFVDLADDTVDSELR